MPNYHTLQTAQRWAQLTLVENDPKTGSGFSVDYWLNYFKEIRAEGVCISAGGYVAYYPTEIPTHHRSQWLGDQDILGEIIEGCRDMGMAVLARIDPHAVRHDVAQAHPDWLALDEQGRPREHWVVPNLWLTCPFSPYSTEVMTDVVAEIAGNYDVDGIFANRWVGHWVSYSEAAQRLHLEATGQEIPREGNPNDPQWRQYRAWNQSALFDLAEKWDQAIRAARPSARFVPNSGGGPLSDLSMAKLSEISPALFMDRQAREGTSPIWINGYHSKEYRAAMGTKPVGAIFSVGVEEVHRWKDSVQSGAELRIWVADAIANGALPWFTKFGGVVRDDRWMPVVSELYRWHDQHGEFFANERPLAQVAVYSSQLNGEFYKDGQQSAKERVESPSYGFAQALVEARIPFEILHAVGIARGELDRYRMVVLPNIAVLTDAEIAAFTAYVEAGGGLVISQETGRYDETFTERTQLPLLDLIGVKVSPTRVGPNKNSYLYLSGDDAARHSIGHSITGTDRIINAVNWLEVTDVSPGTEVAARLLESFPDLPMEDMYPRNTTPGIPQVIAGAYGKGRIAYFAGDLDRIFWEILNPDIGALLSDAVVWAAGGSASPVTVEGPGLVEVTAWQQAHSITVFLVNLNNAMFMKGPTRELLEVGPYQVFISLPEGSFPKGAESVASVQLLRAGTAATWQQRSGGIVVEVPSVTDLEAIAITRLSQ